MFVLRMLLLLQGFGDYYVNWHKNADEPYPSAGGANDGVEATRALSSDGYTPLVTLLKTIALDGTGVVPFTVFWLMNEFTFSTGTTTMSKFRSDYWYYPILRLLF